LADCRGWLKEFLRAQVRPQLAPALRRETDPTHAECGMRNAQALDASRSLPAPQSALHAPRWTLVGVGGTASILARMAANLDQFDRERIEATRLTLARVRWRVEQLWRLPLAERQRLVGLPPDRADVILPGAAIYEAVMHEFGFGELRVSTRGLRFAAVLDGI
jgi:exopolyphosphatase/pppGpp-phosphohydrolase